MTISFLLIEINFKFYKMKKLLCILVLLPLLGFSKSKMIEYGKYHAKCIKMVKDTIMQAGYIRLDTILVNNEPTDNTRRIDGVKRWIIRTVPGNNSKYILVLQDTVWSQSPALEYRNSIVYNEFPGRIQEERSANYDPNFDKFRLVFREKIVKSKAEKPLSYGEWLVYKGYKNE